MSADITLDRSSLIAELERILPPDSERIASRRTGVDRLYQHRLPQKPANPHKRPHHSLARTIRLWNMLMQINKGVALNAAHAAYGDAT